MRRPLGLLAAIALVAAACGGDGGGGGTDPAAANSCEDLADVTVNLMQEAIDAVEGMSITDFLEISETGEMPEALARMETVGEEIERRAEQLGCTEEDAERLVCERIGRLEADSDLAKMILAGIAGEC